MGLRQQAENQIVYSIQADSSSHMRSSLCMKKDQRKREDNEQGLLDLKKKIAPQNELKTFKKKKKTYHSSLIFLCLQQILLPEADKEPRKIICKLNCMEEKEPSYKLPPGVFIIRQSSLKRVTNNRKPQVLS